jgi:hypothetical protein
MELVTEKLSENAGSCVQSSVTVDFSGIGLSPFVSETEGDVSRLVIPRVL